MNDGLFKARLRRTGGTAASARHGGTTHEDMVAILMTQRAEFPLFSPVHQDFWASVYGAIDD
jgi:hypothetical protein